MAENTPDIVAPLRAGIAIFNAGHHHAAHDAWEERWLRLPTDSPDERLLHGLIQFTAAVHHAEHGNWAGATGLATSAMDYLEGLGDSHRDVALAPIRAYLTRLATDPEVIERRAVPLLSHRGNAFGFGELSHRAICIAARVLADELPGYDQAPIAAAIQRIDGPGEEPFAALLSDFVRSPSNRDVVYQRLTALLSRADQRDRDLEGLFGE